MRLGVGGHPDLMLLVGLLALRVGFLARLLHSGLVLPVGVGLGRFVLLVGLLRLPALDQIEAVFDAREFAD
ncbi:MAG: hypothetical protein NVSMB64_06330 [Candidatus Velthaea sp.]